MPICYFATATNYASAADWRFPLGYTFVTGFAELSERYKSNMEEEGYKVEGDFQTFGGIVFSPYVELDTGVRFGVGPIIAILSNIDKSHYELPLNFTVGWSILPGRNISPYVRGGLSVHLASGDLSGRIFCRIFRRCWGGVFQKKGRWFWSGSWI